MKLNRATLRNLILEELRLLKEGYKPITVAGSPRGDNGLYEFNFNESGNTITVTEIFYTPKGGGEREKITTELFGKQGYVTDAGGLKIAKDMFRNNYPGKTVEFEN